MRALDPDIQIETAKQEAGGADPTPEQVQVTTLKLRAEAAKPIASNAALRNKLMAVKKFYEQTIDAVSKDEVVEAGYSADAKEKAKTLVSSFEQFIRDHKDDITALQVLYSKPFGQRLTFKQVKELAEAIQSHTRRGRRRTYGGPMRHWTVPKCGIPAKRVLTDLVSVKPLLGPQ